MRIIQMSRRKASAHIRLFAKAVIDGLLIRLKQLSFQQKYDMYVKFAGKTRYNSVTTV